MKASGEACRLFQIFTRVSNAFVRVSDEGFQIRSRGTQLGRNETRARHSRNRVDFEHDEFAVAVQNHVGSREVAAPAFPMDVLRGLPYPFENLRLDFGRRYLDAGSCPVFRIVVEKIAFRKDDFGRNERFRVGSRSNGSAGEFAARDELLNEDFRPVGEFLCQNFFELLSVFGFVKGNARPFVFRFHDHRISEFERVQVASRRDYAGFRSAESAG